MLGKSSRQERIPKLLHFGSLDVWVVEINTVKGVKLQDIFGKSCFLLIPFGGRTFETCELPVLLF